MFATSFCIIHFVIFTMVTSCEAPKCTNRVNKLPGKSFHQFPLNKPELLHKWVRAIPRDDWTPNKYSYVVIIFIPHVTLTHLDELVIFFVQIQFQQSFQNWKIITNSITREGSLQQRDNVLYQKSYQRWFYKILMILK